ncbi:S1 family peptidase [Pseudoxanthomonas winnipegensis]|uniref:Serine protease n=1 Tax=Pseudoxanthomonas winnipegensis TaxID=2480810 RepID=A0A4V2HER3_9GAMM|nr:serine protease [Pseudoxanthomonas winnipegensis]RZZ84910.1 serine protease [Pseudoxanthomonas winnipegensis]TAA33852.1 serine protease [Pseudoxanthomonas winnipegensis]
MFHSLYSSLKSACCHIVVLLDEEIISEGSGFAFLENGAVMTAAHVVTGRMPIRKEDYLDPKQKIFCKFPGRPQSEYSVALCGLNIRVPGFQDDFQIDMAFLDPIEKSMEKVPHLNANTNPPQLGEMVFVAGYSDELSAPFGLDALLQDGTDALNKINRSTASGYLADMGGPIIKQGVIGNIIRAEVGYGGGQQLDVDLFYIDNSVHSGASGGPVCNLHGEAVGIITRRAVTSASQSEAPGLKIPSGCTIGIGLQPLRALK